ncbi:hypothetical protein GCM10020331_017170 [Ectobacillus funiculus]
MYFFSYGMNSRLQSHGKHGIYLFQGKIIVLDAGHGGPDGGAVGGDEIIEKKKLRLRLRKKVQDYLQEQGALVIMTRTKDEDLADEDTKGYSRRKVEDLRRRVEIVNNSDADFFVSIHLNAIPIPSSRGAQTFFIAVR